MLDLVLKRFQDLSLNVFAMNFEKSWKVFGAAEVSGPYLPILYGCGREAIGFDFCKEREDIDHRLSNGFGHPKTRGLFYGLDELGDYLSGETVEERTLKHFPGNAPIRDFLSLKMRDEAEWHGAVYREGDDQDGLPCGSNAGLLRSPIRIAEGFAQQWHKDIAATQLFEDSFFPLFRNAKIVVSQKAIYAEVAKHTLDLDTNELVLCGVADKCP